MKTQLFRIRRGVVLNALKWLKVHNQIYNNITITESNLDWMNGSDEESLLDDQDWIEVDNNETVSGKSNAAPTVSESQTTLNDEEDIDICGTTLNTYNVAAGDVNNAIVDGLREAAAEAKQKVPVMSFPQVSKEPVNELSTGNIFVSTYPWLFPGGVGDICDQKRSTVTDIARWIEMLLTYEDGRFMKDQTFCFHAEDVWKRYQANSSGSFFMRTFATTRQKNLSELQEQIRSGDTSFLGKIQHFATRIKGSDGYWRAKKDEVESWILYHIDHGNGPPTLFITLSCAEYWWPDLKRVMYDRLKGTEDEYLAKQMMVGSMTATKKIIDTYTAIVQEFYQMRVRKWIEEVGRKVFKIKHWWGRYEFAKGRGQIHIHLLAITENNGVMHEYYKAMYENNDKEKATKIMADYARDVFGMTAQLPEQYCDIDDDDNNAISSRLADADDIGTDFCGLISKCHIHKCNDFCLRRKR